VVAHANAQSVVLRAFSDREKAVLEVIDDGVGFDPAKAEARVSEGHLGLRGLADRIADAGGSFDVTPAHGGGTHVHAEIPLR
jgi:signal transduction histidine kinase